MAFFSPLRPSYIQDPYPALARLREAEPVHFSREIGAWIVTRYEDIRRVLHDFDSFSPDPAKGRPPLSDSYAALHHQSPLRGAARLNRTDPPDHRRLRRAVSDYFTRESVGRTEPLIRSTVERRAPMLAEEFDLVSEYADPLPRSIVLGFLGVSEEEHQQFHAWVRAIRHTEVVPDVSEPAQREADASVDALADYLDERAKAAPSPAHRAVLDSIWTDVQVTEPERLGLIIDLALSGNGAMSATIGNAVHTLLHTDEDHGWPPDDVDAAGAAFEETLRYEAPVSALGRWALRDAEVAGKTIRQGDHVILMVAAANRDPRAFTDPDYFSPSRRGRRPLSFGAGHHLCVGAPLARVAGRYALRELARRFPLLRLAADAAPPTFVRSWMTRHLAALPVVGRA